MRKCSELTRMIFGPALLSLSVAAAGQVAPQPPQASTTQSPQEESKTGAPEASGTAPLRLLAVPLTPLGEPADDAQDSKDAKESKDGAPKNPFGATNMFRARGPVDREELQRQDDEHRKQLRQQLADPKQRARVRAERMPQVRSMHPDVGRVLRLDPRSEEQLFAVLLDHSLESELQGRGFARRRFNGGIGEFGSIDTFTQEQAKTYTRRMQEISKVIGAGRLDAFIDFRRSIAQRMRVEAFDKTLPADDKLTSDQKDAMAVVLARDFERLMQGLRGRGPGRMGLLGPPTATVEERNRSMQMYTLAMNERSLEQMEIAHREMLDQLAAILTPEQSKVFARQQQRQVEGQRAWISQQRNALGLREGEPLDVQVDIEPPVLTTDVQLQFEYNIDGKRISRTLVSKRGGPVSLQTAEGLQIELQPSLMDSEQILMVYVKVYETVRGGRREVHQGGSSVSITNPRKGTPFGNGGGGAYLIEGRKGYAFNWTGSATLL